MRQTDLPCPETLAVFDAQERVLPRTDTAPRIPICEIREGDIVMVEATLLHRQGRLQFRLEYVYLIAQGPCEV